MPDTTVKLQDITPVKSTFDNDDQILLINPTGEARISKEDFLDAMPDDAITLIGDITTTGIVGDTVAKQLGALENSKAAVITDTATGVIANFPDGADDMPVTSLVANIEPKQSGSGDPSPDNIRPITGWTGCNVTRTGKNLLDTSGIPQIVNGMAITANNNGISYSGTASYGGYGQLVSFTLPKAGQYHFHLDGDGLWLRGYTNLGKDITVNVTDTEQIYRLSLPPFTAGNQYSGTISNAQIELGSTATAYEPYITPTTVSLSWQTEAGTVYGGTIDVATGLLTVDKGIITINGSESTWNDEGTRFALVMPNTYADSTVGRISIICDTFRPVMSGGTAGDCFGYFNSGKKLLLYFYPLNGENLSQFKSWLSSNNTQVVYPLATPQTYQLTPQQLLTLLGTNNVWADTGDTSVTYAADTKLYIEKLTMPTEDDLVANQAITSGKYFMIGNSLYLALANIASGAQITIGTNAQRVSLADALNTINS